MKRFDKSVISKKKKMIKVQILCTKYCEKILSKKKKKSIVKKSFSLKETRVIIISLVQAKMTNILSFESRNDSNTHIRT